MLISLSKYRDAIIRLFRGEAAAYLKTRGGQPARIPTMDDIVNAMIDRGREALPHNPAREQSCREAKEWLEEALYGTPERNTQHQVDFGVQFPPIFTDNKILLQADAALQAREAEGFSPRGRIYYRKMVQALYANRGEGVRRLAHYAHVPVATADYLARSFALNYAKYETTDAAINVTHNTAVTLGFGSLSGKQASRIIQPCIGVLEGKTMAEVTPHRWHMPFYQKATVGMVLGGLVLMLGEQQLRYRQEAKERAARGILAPVPEKAKEAGPNRFVPKLMLPVYTQPSDTADAKPAHWAERMQARADADTAQSRGVDKR